MEEDIDTVACLSIHHMSHFLSPTFHCVYYIASSGHRSDDVARGARCVHFVAVLNVFLIFFSFYILCLERHFIYGSSQS